MRVPRPLPALALVVALAFCSASPAAALELKPGFYDCVSYDYATEILQYKGSVKIKGGGSYEHSFGRRKTTMPKKTEGTFTRKGSTLTFKKGALNNSKAKIERNTDGRAYFNLLYNGRPSGISCYFVTKP